MSVGVETRCPCGYHDNFPIFSYNRCRGGCGQSYIAMPLDVNDAKEKAAALLKRVEALSGH